VRARDDAGSAIIEFVFVAVLVMVPLVYLVVAVASVQRSELAVSQAAREAGRAFATSDLAADAPARAQAAVRIALQNQGLIDADLKYVQAGGSCDAAPVVPTLRAGEQFMVCVTLQVDVPGVPTLLRGKGITTVGKYVVHVDDYRDVS
jgi:Flp pilus assembly protein TadG